MPRGINRQQAKSGRRKGPRPLASDQPVLRIRKPAPGAPPLNRVPLPKPAKLKIDVVELLLEDRQR